VKAGILALILIALGAAVVGVWIRRDWNASGSAGDEPAALSRNDTTFLLTAYNFLQSQLSADEEAATHGHFESVRAFARGAATDHRDEKDRVKRLAARLVPELKLEPATPSPKFESGRGASFDRDREYLNSFIQAHEGRLETIQQAFPRDGNPELTQFAGSWTSILNRHLHQSRMLRELATTDAKIARR